MSAAIDMMPRKLPDGDYSHTGAWAFLRANRLKHVGVSAQVLCEKGRGIRTDWSEFDTVYIYHTMILNLIIHIALTFLMVPKNTHPNTLKESSGLRIVM